MELDERSCPECAETIKAAAKVCKHCGSQLSASTDSAPKSPPTRWGRLLIIMGSGVAVAAGLLVVSDPSILKTFQPSGNPDGEKAAKEYISSLLTDPGSATFKGLMSRGRCVLGQVNAKNRLGGYVGYQKFYYDIETRNGQVDPSPLLEPSPFIVDGAGRASRDAFDLRYLACSAEQVSA